MTHEECTSLLSERLDGTLDAATLARVDAHLAGCETCRATSTELQSVVAAAAALEPSAPATDLWPGIAARIAAAAETDVSEDATVAAFPHRAAGGSARRRIAFTLPQLAAAAIAVMLVSGGSMWMLARPDDAPAARADGSPGAGMLVDYEGAEAGPIAELERAVRDPDSRLDPQTVDVLRRNLNLIDAALVEARAALAQDPGNAYLSRHYDNTMRKRQELLRQAGSIGRGTS